MSAGKCADSNAGPRLLHASMSPLLCLVRPQPPRHRKGPAHFIFPGEVQKSASLVSILGPGTPAATRESRAQKVYLTRSPLGPAGSRPAPPPQPQPPVSSALPGRGRGSGLGARSPSPCSPRIVERRTRAPSRGGPAAQPHTRRRPAALCPATGGFARGRGEGGPQPRPARGARAAGRRMWFAPRWGPLSRGGPATGTGWRLGAGRAPRRDRAGRSPPRLLPILPRPRWGERFWGRNC